MGTSKYIKITGTDLLISVLLALVSPCTENNSSLMCDRCSFGADRAMTAFYAGSSVYCSDIKRTHLCKWLSPAWWPAEGDPANVLSQWWGLCPPGAECNAAPPPTDSCQHTAAPAGRTAASRSRTLSSGPLRWWSGTTTDWIHVSRDKWKRNIVWLDTGGTNGGVYL